MPTIDTDKLIKEYWETVKEKYSNFTFEQFETVCKSPFRFFKSRMESDNPPTVIHIKFLGKIRMYPSYVKRLLVRNDLHKKSGNIDAEEHSRREAFYNIRLKQAQDYEDSKGNKEDLEGTD